MIRFAPFIEGDARTLFATAGVAMVNIAQIERAGAESGRAWTMLRDGMPRAVGGIVDLWPGVAELWSFRADDLTAPEGMAFARFCRRTADAIGVRRLQATARADNGKALDFLFFLGMDPEGVLRGFDPDGTDHVQYARVRPAPDTGAP